MEIQTLPLATLQPASYNPRIELRPGMPGYERLARSLDEFELVQPLVWNRRTGNLVGGHQRKAILQARGETEVACVVVDLDDDRERALNIALNNDRVGGAFDPAGLQAVLEGLRDAPLDETLTGFDAADLSEMLLEPDAAFEPIEEPTPEHVTVTLEVPPPDWTEVQSWLTALLDAEPAVRVHVADERIATDA